MGDFSTPFPAFISAHSMVQNAHTFTLIVKTIDKLKHVPKSACFFGDKGGGAFVLRGFKNITRQLRRATLLSRRR
ncbi:hypothetical protein BDZ89DRAFT_1062521 [Hymenopellis radicata]|nr:hypothetical protein BDZ89DRAFT_1062521 [Hymenopellis radicata]